MLVIKRSTYIIMYIHDNCKRLFDVKIKLALNKLELNMVVNRRSTHSIIHIRNNLEVNLDVDNHCQYIEERNVPRWLIFRRDLGTHKKLRYLIFRRDRGTFEERS